MIEFRWLDHIHIAFHQWWQNNKTMYYGWNEYHLKADKVASKRHMSLAYLRLGKYYYVCAHVLYKTENNHPITIRWTKTSKTFFTKVFWFFIHACMNQTYIPLFYFLNMDGPGLLYTCFAFTLSFFSFLTEIKLLGFSFFSVTALSLQV